MATIVLNIPDDYIKRAFEDMLDGSVDENLKLKSDVTQDELNAVATALVEWSIEGRLLVVIDAAVEFNPAIFKQIVES